MEKWYTEDELIIWLKKNKYSESIAKELSPFLTKAFNSAFRKGFEKGQESERNRIEDLVSDEERSKECNCTYMTSGEHAHFCPQFNPLTNY